MGAQDDAGAAPANSRDLSLPSEGEAEFEEKTRKGARRSGVKNRARAQRSESSSSPKSDDSAKGAAAPAHGFAGSSKRKARNACGRLQHSCNVLTQMCFTMHAAAFSQRRCCCYQGYVLFSVLIKCLSPPLRSLPQRPVRRSCAVWCMCRRLVLLHASISQAILFGAAVAATAGSVRIS